MTVTSRDEALEQDARCGVVPALIRLDGVSRVYGSGEGAVHALSAVDLEVREGEFVVVLGPSGSGKTTLLNVIGALDVATEGRVVVGGVDIDEGAAEGARALPARARSASSSRPSTSSPA